MAAFKVMTPEGEKCMVILTGPSSYRLNNLFVKRGDVITVTERTRNYLVRRTGFFADFDPTPAEPLETFLPSQFGVPKDDLVDADDFDPTKNPSLSTEQAAALAAGVNPNTGKPLHEADDDDGPTMTAADAAKLKDDTSGDMTGGDLKNKTKTGGSKTVTKPTTGTKSTYKPGAAKAAEAPTEAVEVD